MNAPYKMPKGLMHSAEDLQSEAARLLRTMQNLEKDGSAEHVRDAVGAVERMVLVSNQFASHLINSVINQTLTVKGR